MSGYVQTRVKSGKGIGGQVAHDLRRKKPAYIQKETEVALMLYKKWDYGNTTPHRIYGDDLNHIKDIQSQIKTEMQNRIVLQKQHYKEKHGRSMPNSSNHFFKGLITFSKEDIEGNTTNDKDKFKLDTCTENYLDLMLETYGTLPLYYVRHEDETTVHYHFVSENFNYNEARTVLRRLVKFEFSKMQNMVGQTFKDLGYKRGKSKYDTKSEHIDFSTWQNEQNQQSKEEVTDTIQIIKNTKLDINDITNLNVNVKNELLEILKLIAKKEQEIEAVKEILLKYKQARKAYIESHTHGMTHEEVLELRKLEENTGDTRSTIKILRVELKELIAKKDEITSKFGQNEQIDESSSKIRKNR